MGSQHGTRSVGMNDVQGYLFYVHVYLTNDLCYLGKVKWIEGECLECVKSITIHVAIAIRNATVTEQDGHL